MDGGCSVRDTHAVALVRSHLCRPHPHPLTERKRSRRLLPPAVPAKQRRLHRSNHRQLRASHKSRSRELANTKRSRRQQFICGIWTSWSQNKSSNELHQDNLNSEHRSPQGRTRTPHPTPHHPSQRKSISRSRRFFERGRRLRRFSTTTTDSHSATSKLLLKRSHGSPRRVGDRVPISQRPSWLSMRLAITRVFQRNASGYLPVCSVLCGAAAAARANTHCRSKCNLVRRARDSLMERHWRQRVHTPRARCEHGWAFWLSRRRSSSREWSVHAHMPIIRWPTNEISADHCRFRDDV